MKFLKQYDLNFFPERLLFKLEKYINMKRCNAVVEGADPDTWHRLSYMAIPLKVPKDTGVINDSHYLFMFQGKTNDFNSINDKKNGNGIEAKVSPIDFADIGFELGDDGKFRYSSGFPDLLTSPRTICLKDGRVFVRGDRLKDDEYMKKIPNILLQSRELFGYIKSF